MMTNQPVVPTHFLPLARHVLVIEDDPLMHAVFKYYLTTLGHEHIDFLFNAEEALAKDLSQYHLIISDFNLGNGRNGAEFCTALRLNGILMTPVILISVIRNSIIREACRHQLAQGFLEKPFSIKELGQMIGQVIQQVPKKPSEIETHNSNALPWVQLILDLVEGADFSYSRIAYRLHVSPSTIQKLATNYRRKPRPRLFIPLVGLHYKIFQGPYATTKAREYWTKKYRR